MTADLVQRVDNGIRVLTGMHDSAERSRMCHEMLDSPRWLLDAIERLTADLKYARESWGLVDLKCQELTGRLAAAERVVEAARDHADDDGGPGGTCPLAEALRAYDTADLNLGKEGE